MSNILYRAKINRELKKLNQRIDLNILWGRSYREEASRHKALLQKLRKTSRGGLLTRAMSYMTLF